MLHREAQQTGSLAQAHIYRKVFWTTERIAADAGNSTRLDYSDRSRQARHRKFPPGLMKASLLVSSVHRQNISADATDRRSYWNLPSARTVPCAESTENRCVPSGCHQAASPQRFTDKVTSIPEERQVPQARNIQIVSHVKIRWTTLLTQILWKRLIRFRTWAFV